MNQVEYVSETSSSGKQSFLSFEPIIPELATGSKHRKFGLSNQISFSPDSGRRNDDVASLKKVAEIIIQSNGSAGAFLD